MVQRRAEAAAAGSETYLIFEMQDSMADGWSGIGYEIWDLNNAGADETLTIDATGPGGGWTGNTWTLKDGDGNVLGTDTCCNTESWSIPVKVGDNMTWTVTEGSGTTGVAWSLKVGGVAFWSVQDTYANTKRFPTEQAFVMPGSLLASGTMLSGSTKIERIAATVGDQLALSVVEGGSTTGYEVSWALKEQDYDSVFSAEVGAADEVKFPLLSTFTVLGVQCQHNEFSWALVYYDDSQWNQGFQNMFAVGDWVYLVPTSSHNKIFRVDGATFTQVEVLSYDTAGISVAGYQNFNTGFVDDAGYVYLLPGNGNSYLVKVDLTFTSASTLSVNSNGFKGAILYGVYAFLVPEGGIIEQIDLMSFYSVTTLDLSYQDDSYLRSFSAGFTDGTYGYLVPYQDSFSSNSGKLVRFDLASFSSSITVDVVDFTTNSHPNAFYWYGFAGGYQDGTYGYMATKDSNIIVRFRSWTT
ncbi:unnamed protein product [Effrenium voratum]|uniref:Uncharacterized protein n=1 Tax=Effrenium voratum TaxID=2562239 RepID=A0AA36J827_9DINO|nr:unnamed protein product [Effrenium voratum]